MYVLGYSSRSCMCADTGLQRAAAEYQAILHRSCSGCSQVLQGGDVQVGAATAVALRVSVEVSCGRDH